MANSETKWTVTQTVAHWVRVLGPLAAALIARWGVEATTADAMVADWSAAIVGLVALVVSTSNSLKSREVLRDAEPPMLRE
jgi:hypothetical protein